MASVIEGVDQRTNLVGRNRLELLLFRLSGRQRFGINVFKVREVIRCPSLTRIPQSHGVVAGVANMRGKTITIMDLGLAIGTRPVANPAESFVVVTEFNRRVQGFLVGSVDRIVNMNWEEIMPPPQAAGKQSYMTAVTKVDDELIEIIDVEKVLAEVTGGMEDLSDELISEAADRPEAKPMAFVVDDSSVARNQITRALKSLGIEYETASNGLDGLRKLRAMLDDGVEDLADRIGIIICDVEMPEMDGYTLTKEIKSDERMKNAYVMLHTSLSGVFNTNMVKKVGADEFLPKFQAEELGRRVLEVIDERSKNGVRPAA